MSQAGPALPSSSPAKLPGLAGWPYKGARTAQPQSLQQTPTMRPLLVLLLLAALCTDLGKRGRPGRKGQGQTAAWRGCLWSQGSAVSAWIGRCGE